jgi:RHS repeat-associated protein
MSVWRQLPLFAVLALTFLPGFAKADDVVEYYHVDALGNVRLITDEDGDVVERHDYYPFGEECTTGPCASNPGVGAGQARKFTGKERDTETGLDYFGARYYGSKIGRFTTVDPVYTWNDNLLDPQRWNRYSYGLNNPLKYNDPDGRAVDIIVDVGSITYDVADIYATYRTGSSPTTTQWLALGGDALGAAVPFVTGVGAAIRAGNRIDDATDAGKATGLAKDGRYEFPDQAAGGTPYVGQSGNIPRRLRDHEKAGRLAPGTELTTPVPGGKTAREIAEHKRIQEITGGMPARQSDSVSNKVDPIGPNRRHLLDEKE